MNPNIKLLFAPEKAELPFQSAEAYLQERFRILDFFLAEYAAKRQAGGKSDSGIPALRRLAESLAQPQEKELQDQRAYLHEYLQKRGRKTEEEGLCLPLFELEERLHFTPLTSFLLTVGLAVKVPGIGEDLRREFNVSSSKKAPALLEGAALYFTGSGAYSVCCCMAAEAGRQLLPLLREPADGLYSIPLDVDDSVLAFACGSSVESEWIRILDPQQLSWPESPRLSKTAEQAVRALKNGRICIISGERGSGRHTAAMIAAGQQRKALLLLNGEQLLLAEPSLRRAVLRKMHVLCILYDGICVVEDPERLPDEGDAVFLFRILREEIERKGIPCIVLTAQDGQQAAAYFEQGRLLRIREMTALESAQLWQLACEELELGAFDYDMLAGSLKLTPGKIREAAALAAEKRLGGTAFEERSLIECAAEAGSLKLEEKAVRIKPFYSWDDLVLPPESKRLLTLACGQMRCRRLVFEEWGLQEKMDYGRGVSILLCGPPGTGKTMTAQILAGELGLPLYRIDLSKIIDKYIGETEKNLGVIFSEAGKSNCILFFDEADALFARRSQVNTSNDRSANAETAYLLQCVEAYEGITILATNYQNNMDEAFKRRMKFTVEFPFPDEAARLSIWQNCMPEQMPKNSDIDFSYLAQRYRLSGGNIRNAVYNAAFIAAQKGGIVGMRELLYAVKQEYRKSGQLFVREDYGIYAQWFTE